MSVEFKLTVEADETAFDLFRRLRSKPLKTGLAALDQAAGLRGGFHCGDVIEICGPSGSAKTEFLMNVAVQHALLPEWKGNGGLVFYFDLDCRLDIQRLQTIAHNRICEPGDFLAGRFTAPPGRADASGPAQSTGYAEKFLLDCLSRIKVVSVASTSELLVALGILNAELGNTSAVVMIDSLAMCHVRDKIIANSGMVSAVVSKLTALLKERNVYLFATRPILSTLRHRLPFPDHSDYMPENWRKIVTYRMAVVRQPRSQIADSCSLFSVQVSRVGSGNVPALMEIFVVKDKGIVSGGNYSQEGFD